MDELKKLQRQYIILVDAFKVLASALEEINEHTKPPRQGEIKRAVTNITDKVKR